MDLIQVVQGTIIKADDFNHNFTEVTNAINELLSSPVELPIFNDTFSDEEMWWGWYKYTSPYYTITEADGKLQFRGNDSTSNDSWSSGGFNYAPRVGVPLPSGMHIIETRISGMDLSSEVSNHSDTKYAGLFVTNAYTQPAALGVALTAGKNSAGDIVVAISTIDGLSGGSPSSPSTVGMQIPIRLRIMIATSPAYKAIYQYNLDEDGDENWVTVLVNNDDLILAGEPNLIVGLFTDEYDPYNHVNVDFDYFKITQLRGPG